ncbi:MAG TPA: alcohol dehydrogenase catalytic domain-containing protein [Kofleriaceae bacterium]|nr:alcohol dehydrogenase catalytic domain-containing protein [Kofleriaceae bacterium]
MARRERLAARCARVARQRFRAAVPAFGVRAEPADGRSRRALTYSSAMRALRVADGATSLVDIAPPEPRGEAIVRVTLSGICNTDLEIARGYAGFRGTLGHELVGVVEDAGGGALAPGTRVVGEINAGCGACARCAGGDPRHCATRTVLGIVGRDGAHADLVRLPGRNLVRVPDVVPDLSAVFVEPLAAACGVVERAPHVLDAQARVAVIGDGKLGLLCAMVLAARGARPLVIGKHAAKLALAGKRGIETASVEQARARGRSFDVVVEASGDVTGFAVALDLLRPQGTLVLKSTFHGATPVDAARLVVEEITVIGSRCGRFAPALDLLERGAVDVTDLVSDVISLDRAEDALARASAPGVLKILLSTGA